MFLTFRTEVVATLATALPNVAGWDVIPDDVNELPCYVVGRPGGRPANEKIVMDLSLQVFILGRRQQAGGSEDELVALADDVFTALGGTRGTKSPSGEVVTVSRVDPRTLSIAGNDVPAYSIEVTASAATC